MQKTEIGMTEFFMMVGLAIFIDIIEILISIFTAGGSSIFSGVFQYGIYFIWFKYHGGSFLFRKKGMASNNTNIVRDSKIKKAPEKQSETMSLSWNQLIGFAFESLPVIDWLPIFTFNVYTQIKAHNQEVYDSRKELESNNDNIIRNSKRRY